ncbi:cytochrome P450 [Flagelloscypha sp. PMI_526]|nr:cytochrome P450 [Flagelloscypha sp. PMI_526]
MVSPRLYGLDGILFHLVFANREIDFQLPSIVIGLAIYFTAGFVWAISSQSISFLQVIVSTAVHILTFNMGLWSSIILHRLFLHRLRNFPGPWAAKLTRIWALWVQKDKMQMHLVTQQLHYQYGDIVRIGPRELSINKASAIPDIYGLNSKCTKSPWYSKHPVASHDNSLINVRDPNEHRRRRRAWDRGLNPQALTVYEARVSKKAGALIASLKQQIFSKDPIDLTAWCSFFAFDVMGDIGLGKDFETVETGSEPPSLRFIRQSMQMVALGGTLPWLVRLRALLPRKASEGFVALCAYSRDQVAEKRMTLAAESTPQDILSWLVQTRFENDKSAPSERALEEDARLVILAGSDTSASAITNAVYYLASNPSVLRSLQEALDTACPVGDSSWSYDAVKDIKLLDYIIHETLRLAPPVAGGLPRLTPKNGMVIDDTYIPGDVVVSVPTYTIQRDPRYFKRPEEFWPERWQGLIHGPDSSKEGYIPFTRGAYACVGKHAAWMEMKVVLSRLVLNFDFTFNSVEDTEIFEKYQKDTFTLAIPPLKMFLKERVMHSVMTNTGGMDKT